jgi:hypothetical protein
VFQTISRVMANAPVSGLPPTAGYTGILSVNGNQLMNGPNGTGEPIYLYGYNVAIWDAPIYSNEPAANQIWGNGGPGGPPWATLKAMGINAIRVTMNAAAFLNLQFATVTGTASAPVFGALHQSDPNGLIKNAWLTLLFWCRYYGFYVIVDCHSSAPSYNFGSGTNFVGAWGQPMFMDTACALPYWTAGFAAGPGVTDSAGYASSGIVAFTQHYAVNPATGSINDIVWELFNEPYLDQQSVNYNTQNLGAGSALTATQLMGRGGWCSGYCNQGASTGTLNPGSIPVGIPSSLYGASGQTNTTTDAFCFNWWWPVASYQQALNGIRALGATGVIQVNGPGFTSGFSKVTDYFPVDTLATSQVSLGWHNYPNGGSGSFPSSDDGGSGGTKYALQFAEAMLAGASSYTVNGNSYTGLGFPVPIIATETGTSGGANLTTPDPYIRSIVQWSQGQTDTTTGTPFVGKFSVLPWACPSPNNGYIPQAFGNTSSVQYQTVIYGAPITFTGSISTTVQSGFPAGTGTITVSNPNGNVLSAGCVITGGASTNGVVFGPQISGTPGGAGVYVGSLGISQASTTLTGQYWLSINGEGLTFVDFIP